MIKSRLVVVGNLTEAQVKNYRHDIEKILNELSSLNELNNIGIKSFQKDSNKQVYLVRNIEDKDITIDDFTDIRYTPKFGDYSNAHETILNTTNIMLSISEKILTLNQPR